MHAGPGFRARTDIARPDPDVIAGFRAFETPDISDLLNRLYTMSSRIRNVTDHSLKIIGPACTVKVFPGDNLMVHKALDVARPGDVIVVDAAGQFTTAVLGALVSPKARPRGVAGFVVAGLVRDIPAIRTLGDFPVFAQGITPIGPLHRGPGEINFPVSVGGVVVNPGDLIVGDLNGVVVVPRESAPELLARLRERSAAEAEYIAAVARGDFSNAWVDSMLSEAGFKLENADDGE